MYQHLSLSHEDLYVGGSTGILWGWGEGVAATCMYMHMESIIAHDTFKQE